MNRLTDEAPSRPLPVADALNNIEAAVRYVANSRSEDGLESDVEAAGRQLVLDRVADALATVAQRVSNAQKPVAVSAVG